jgi:GNAT superfamily N-acetyltransferase
MPERPQLIRITAPGGEIVAGEWLSKAESVHHQLRPGLQPDYAAQMQRIFAGGAQMVVAADASRVLGLAVWRIYSDTFSGLKFYVDDLVTDEACRSQGVGRALIAWLGDEARRTGANAIALDSGTQRTSAHRFYFREGFIITSFNFKKQLT